MKLVVDTNIVLSALIKNSTTRSILQNPSHSFYLPEYAIEEVRKYFDLIQTKSGLTKKDLDLLFDVLLSNLKVVAMEEILRGFDEASDAMSNVDEKDVPFVALALSISCDGIWSNDGHLKEQKLVKVWNTAEIVERLEKSI